MAVFENITVEITATFKNSNPRDSHGKIECYAYDNQKKAFTIYDVLADTIMFKIIDTPARIASLISTYATLELDRLEYFKIETVDV
jgi:hypothetical protein